MPFFQAFFLITIIKIILYKLEANRQKYKLQPLSLQIAISKDGIKWSLVLAVNSLFAQRGAFLKQFTTPTPIVNENIADVDMLNKKDLNDKLNDFR